jgi:hypothetical protein
VYLYVTVGNSTPSDPEVDGDGTYAVAPGKYLSLGQPSKTTGKGSVGERNVVVKVLGNGNVYTVARGAAPTLPVNVGSRSKRLQVTVMSGLASMSPSTNSVNGILGTNMGISTDTQWRAVLPAFHYDWAEGDVTVRFAISSAFLPEDTDLARFRFGYAKVKAGEVLQDGYTTVATQDVDLFTQMVSTADGVFNLDFAIPAAAVDVDAQGYSFSLEYLGTQSTWNDGSLIILASHVLYESNM